MASNLQAIPFKPQQRGEKSGGVRGEKGATVEQGDNRRTAKQKEQDTTEWDFLTYAHISQGHPAAAGTWMDVKPELEEAGTSHASFTHWVLNGLLLCTGDMSHLDDYMQGMLTLITHY